MHFSALLTFVFCAFSLCVQADLTTYLGDLPPCGLKCILAIVPLSVCGITNQTCICTNQELSATVTQCVTQNCTVIESLQVKNISSISCNVQVQSQQRHLASTVGLEAVAIVAGVLRLGSRWKFEGGFKTDDYIMLAVLVLSIPFACVGVLASVRGFGLNIWDIGTQNITNALKLFFAGELLYLPILALCKVSIIMFYLRIFPSRIFLMISYAILGLVTLSTVAIWFATLFQCAPISYNWEGWKGDYAGSCTDISALAYSSASINILLDFAVLFLPIPWLLTLQVGLRKKIQVLLMFSIGIFICITSIIRLTKLVQFRLTQNPTWDYVDTTFWTAIETYVSIIVPCLPAVRAFLANSFPTIFGMDSQDRSRRYYEQSQSGRTGDGTFKMSSGLKKSQTGSESDTRNRGSQSSLGRIKSNGGDSSQNRKISLGDETKGKVYTDIMVGNVGDNVAVEGREGIFVSTETQVEATGRITTSAMVWDETSSTSSGNQREVPIREHP